jgi:formiminotetrahydrofolate cyclodeaminase
MPRDSRPSPLSSLSEWIDAVAAPPPSPAGGSAAAIAAALAAALASMVARLTRGKESYASIHPRVDEVLARATPLREESLDLAVRDAEAFEKFLAARGEARTEALREAASVQLELLRASASAADLAATMADVGVRSALGDAATSVFLAAAAARSAYWAMRADLDPAYGATGKMLSSGLELLEGAEAAEWRVRQILNERIR